MAKKRSKRKGVVIKKGKPRPSRICWETVYSIQCVCTPGYQKDKHKRGYIDRQSGVALSVKRIEALSRTILSGAKKVPICVGMLRQKAILVVKRSATGSRSEITAGLPAALPHDNNIADFTLPRGPLVIAPSQLAVQVHRDLDVLEFEALGCARAHYCRRRRHARTRRAADREARAGTDRPFVCVLGAAPLQETEAVPFFFPNQSELFVHGARLFADFDVVVRPPVLLVGVLAREEASARHVVNTGGDQAASYEVDGVVVVQVHGRPPQPADVEEEDSTHAGKAEAHEKGLEGRICGVQGGKSAKRHRCRREACRVHVDTKQFVDTRQARRRA